MKLMKTMNERAQAFGLLLLFFLLFAWQNGLAKKKLQLNDKQEFADNA